MGKKKNLKNDLEICRENAEDFRCERNWWKQQAEAFEAENKWLLNNETWRDWKLQCDQLMEVISELREQVTRLREDNEWLQSEADRIFAQLIKEI